MSSTLAILFLFNYENEEGVKFDDVILTAGDTAKVVPGKNTTTDDGRSLDDLLSLFAKDERDVFDYTTANSGLLVKSGDQNTKVELYNVGFSQAYRRPPQTFNPNGVYPSPGDDQVRNLAILFGGEATKAKEKFDVQQRGDKVRKEEFIYQSVKSAYKAAYGFSTVVYSEETKVSSYFLVKEQPKVDNKKSNVSTSAKKARTSKDEKPNFKKHDINKDNPFMAKGVGSDFAEEELKSIYVDRIKGQTLRKADVVAILNQVFAYAYEKRVAQFEPYFRKQTNKSPELTNAGQCIYSSRNYRGYIVLSKNRFLAVGH